MNEDLSFLRAVLHRPEDDELRLVYADWLEDHDDPRAAFLRIGVEQRRRAAAKQRRNGALTRRLNALTPTLDPRWVMWLRWADNLPPGGRLDLALVENGRGLLEVRGDGGEVALLVEGKPVALNWYDNQGSIGQHLVYTGHDDGNACWQQIATLVEGDIDPLQPLAEQVEPLLTLFRSGLYRLVYTPSANARDTGTVERPGNSRATWQLTGYYPFDGANLVCTQPQWLLDPERVAYFRDSIQTGARPVVLTISAVGAICEFVIDGHHKLAAYAYERVPPSVLAFVVEEAAPLTLDEGLGCLPDGHALTQEYRRYKDYLMQRKH